MADTILLTMDDLETAVRVNATFEADGEKTVLVSAMDDIPAAVKGANPDIIILTGALHERPARALIQLARVRSTSTLGLLEETEPDARKIALELGLTGWLVKPVDGQHVMATARRLMERRRLQERTGILGESPAVQEMLVKIEQMAPVSSTVLIEGESGTGKELAAHALHELSNRRDQPFIAVNCSALPETLLESELFGHEKGAFTGAAERRLGRFELAHRGTLFLDEVGDMSPATQVKLLRVLENHSFFRVGGSEAIHADVRVVVATNRRLKEVVAMGEFREDLFFRINVLSIYLPPLRERRGDIPLLVRHFVKEFSEEHNRPFRGITPEAMQLLVSAHWPGNVRQLRNLIESMVVLAPGQEIRATDIPSDIREEGTRLLPMRMPGGAPKTAGRELEFIFRSLMDLKLKMEELSRRMDEHASRGVEAIEVGGGSAFRSAEPVAAIDLSGFPQADETDLAEPVLYQPGMTMADAEKATIEGALRENAGNRRKAAETLGIGERTLYRKIKEYGLA
ncbi:MAG: sigma-54-dependent Fis family transcriptional regulator [Gemmatimonadetes bacterium]|nr:sigma-54-dependent Fis family transcriptional regulator [Gemmatimonadota bacterium]